MIDPALLGYAFGLGTATFFAPCAFPLLPGYVAYFLGQDGETRSWGGRLRRAVVVSLVTSLGFLVVFGSLAAVVFVLGTQILGDIAVLELVAGAVLIVLGVGMAAGRTGAVVHVSLPERRRGPVGFFLFGVVYAAAAAGCTGSLFVGVVGLALTGPATAVATVGAYAAGMVALLVGVTALTAVGRGAVLSRLTARTELLARVAGLALVGAGLVQLYYFFVVYEGLALL